MGRNESSKVRHLCLFNVLHVEHPVDEIAHSLSGIAEALGTKIYCNDNKLALLQAQDDPALHDLITRDPFEAQGMPSTSIRLDALIADLLVVYVLDSSAHRVSAGNQAGFAFILPRQVFKRSAGIHNIGWTATDWMDLYRRRKAREAAIDREDTGAREDEEVLPCWDDSAAG